MKRIKLEKMFAKNTQVSAFFYSLLKFLLLSLFLCSCTVGPNYKQPKFSHLPSKWKSSQHQFSVSDNMIMQQTWWKQFNDPVLNILIHKAITNNLEIKMALARIKEARARELTAKATLFPDISLAIDPEIGNPGFLTQNRKMNFFQSSLDASWEIDLFGENRRKIEATKAFIEMSMESQRDVLVSLLADVARNYIQLRAVQVEENLNYKNSQSVNESLKLHRSLQRAGLANDIDSIEGNSLYQQSRGQLFLLTAKEQAIKNQLSILIGEPPGSLNTFLKSQLQIPSIKKRFFITTPAFVIAHRPDVRQAERFLAAATALQGVSQAKLFPNITLGALFGIQTTNLFPSVNVWSVGSHLLLPLLNFGAIRSQITIANAEQEQAFYRYKQTILKAFAEVETNLSAYLASEKQLHTANKIVANKRLILKLAEERYRKGISPFSLVLNARQSLFTAENEAAKSKAEVSQYFVAIYKSLGGGWALSD